MGVGIGFGLGLGLRLGLGFGLRLGLAPPGRATRENTLIELCSLALTALSSMVLLCLTTPSFAAAMLVNGCPLLLLLRANELLTLHTTQSSLSRFEADGALKKVQLPDGSTRLTYCLLPTTSFTAGFSLFRRSRAASAYSSL